MGVVGLESILLFVLAAAAVVVVVRWVANRTGIPAAALLPPYRHRVRAGSGPQRHTRSGHHPDVRAATTAVQRRFGLLVAGDPPQPPYGGEPFGGPGPAHRAGDRLRLRVVRRRCDPGRWNRGRRCGRTARPGGRPGGRAQGGATTALRSSASPSRRPRAAASPSHPRSVSSSSRRRAGSPWGCWSLSPSACCRGRCRDPLIANAASLATPFGAYLIAEQIHVSGVLAVVVTWLIVGHHTPHIDLGCEPAADQCRLAAGRLPARGLRVPADRPTTAWSRTRAREIRHLPPSSSRPRSASSCYYGPCG
jgi:monovalent cation/hydrogen antiporter